MIVCVDCLMTGLGFDNAKYTFKALKNKCFNAEIVYYIWD